MLRLLSFCLIVLSLAVMGCEKIVGPDIPPWAGQGLDNNNRTAIGTFSGTEDLLVTSTGTVSYNSYGICRRGGCIQFTVTNTNDNRFSGVRIQRDSIYTTPERETLIKGTFEWTNDNGSWAGTFSGTFSMTTGVFTTLKGNGSGAYEGLYFECNSSCPGDPNNATGTGTFEGTLYQNNTQ